MNDELQKIDGLISKDLPAFIKSNYQIRAKLLVDFRIALRDEVEGIKYNFTKTVTLFDRKQDARYYIRFHQQNLIRLSCYLTQYANPKVITKPQIRDHTILCQYLFRSLNELLDFVGKYYSTLIDLNAWLPTAYRKLILHSIDRDLGQLEHSLATFKANSEIEHFTLFPFREFLKISSQNEVTYGRFRYLKELQNELNILFSEGEPPDPSIAVQWRLLYLNYNFSKYFHYCTDQITEYYKEVDTISEQIERLTLVAKLIGQFQTKTKFSYDYSSKPLKDQLTDWIALETYYLETRLQYLSAPSEPLANDKKTNYKVKIDLSVAQVAYLIRVFVEVNILQSQSVTFLLRYIPKLFHTKRADSISYDSLQSKYYKPESSTKKAIRDLLLRMANYIEKSEYLT